MEVEEASLAALAESEVSVSLPTISFDEELGVMGIKECADATRASSPRSPVNRHPISFELAAPVVEECMDPVKPVKELHWEPILWDLLNISPVVCECWYNGGI